MTYRQSVKNTVRHKVLKRAVELLTTERSSACCVRSSYVRDLYDYFIERDTPFTLNVATQEVVTFIFSIKLTVSLFRCKAICANCAAPPQEWVMYVTT